MNLNKRAVYTFAYKHIHKSIYMPLCHYNITTTCHYVTTTSLQHATMSLRHRYNMSYKIFLLSWLKKNSWRLRHIVKRL